MERAAAMAAPHTPAHPFVPAAWSGSQGNVSSLLSNAGRQACLIFSSARHFYAAICNDVFVETLILLSARNLIDVSF
jgi:hypothetical protein